MPASPSHGRARQPRPAVLHHEVGRQRLGRELGHVGVAVLGGRLVRAFAEAVEPPDGALIHPRAGQLQPRQLLAGRKVEIYISMSVTLCLRKSAL